MGSADHTVTLETTLGSGICTILVALFIVLIFDRISDPTILGDIRNDIDTLKAAGIFEDTDANKSTQLTP